MLFAGMRRGGRAIYAFNVTNPDQPRLMWRINNWFSGYGSIGQTWSMPRVSRVKGRTDPVLIMGGGYDTNAEDVTPAGTTTIGRGVYIMNMRTGELLGWLPTDYSVPADVTVIDTDGDGYVDRVYVVDVRAQLYRIDMEEAARHAARAGRVGDHQDRRAERRTDRLTGSRKVYFAPDVVITRNYTALLFGHRRPREAAADDDERSLLRHQGPARSRRASRPRCR